MQVSEHERQWLQREGAKMVSALGVQTGSSVIDFGCGKGRYTIPLSQAVGEGGKVYAVERNTAEIELLHERIADFGRQAQIEVLQSEDTQLHSITDNTIDAVFAFDVLQYVSDWDAFFTSLYRILKPTGRVHVYPAAIPHPDAVDVSKLSETLDNAGFQPERTDQFMMMHNKDMVTDTVHTFRPLV